MKVRVRKPIVVTEEEQARVAREAAKYTATREEAARRARPYNERVLVASGVSLRDVTAALDCHCGCHPRVNLEMHEGGSRCPCQMTTEERHQSAADLLKLLSDLSHDNSESISEEHISLREKADELGVEAEIACLAAPFAIAGNVDGRGFYLRERHGVYRVTISGDDDPGANPWSTRNYVSQLDIAQGDGSDFANVGEALEIAVAAVRTYLRQRACTEPHDESRSRYCPNCGEALRPPSAP